MTRLRFTYTFEVDPRSRTACNLQAKEVSREDEGVAMALAQGFHEVGALID